MPNFNEEKLKRVKKIDRIIKLIYPFPKNRKIYPPIIKEDVKEIIILAFLLLGDTVMYEPAIRTIKKNFPNSKITLVCGNLVSTILGDQNLIDDFIIANCPWISPFDVSFKNISNFLLSLKKVNTKQYDLAIDFRGDWRNIFYMNFIQSKRKISFNYSGGDYMLTDIIIPIKRAVHLIDEQFSLLDGLNCEYNEIDKYPILKLNNTDKLFLNEFKDKNILKNQFIVGIHPGASLEERRWDEENYGRLIINLSKRFSNYKFFIFEGPNETISVNKITSFLRNESVDYLVINKSLKEYLTLINCCNILICNDSGAAHIGAAYNIPVVVIFGKGEPLEVRPFGKNIIKIVSHELECKPCHLINCKFGTNLCMKLVSVEEVLAQVVDIQTFI